MKKGIIGKEAGHDADLLDEDGSVIPVTVIEAGPCAVSQMKTSGELTATKPFSSAFEDIAARKLVTKAGSGSLQEG